MDTYLQRKKRGWVESSELLAFQDHSVAELLVLLSDEQALLRTIAAHLLPINCETTNFLLAALIVEPALYTRLAIMEKLESGDQMTARQMLPLLAEIGNNQHSTPIDPSKKSSLAARFNRSLIRSDAAQYFSYFASGRNGPPRFKAE